MENDGLIHISFVNVYFHCPHCNTVHNDEDEKYLDRCNNNMMGYTKIKCFCGEKFGMSYDIKGDAVSFTLEKEKDGKRKKGIIDKIGGVEKAFAEGVEKDILEEGEKSREDRIKRFEK